MTWLLLLMLFSEAATEALPTHFPNFEGKNLNGETLVLSDFKAPVTLIFVAFKQEQQPQVDGWINALGPLRQSHPSFDYVELPTIKPVSRIVRFMIYRGMRSGIKDAEKRARIVTQYVDIPSYMETLHLTDEDVIASFAVGKDGRVLKRWLGPVSDDAISELSALLVRRNAVSGGP